MSTVKFGQSSYTMLQWQSKALDIMNNILFTVVQA